MFVKRTAQQAASHLKLIKYRHRHFCATTSLQQDAELPARDAMQYDVVIVGGGPAGLSTAIKVKQLAKEKNTDISVCVVEKGQAIGAHSLSGACMELRSLKELFPQGEWDPNNEKNQDPAPLNTAVTKDRMYFLTKSAAIPVPMIPQLNNHGNYIVSIGQLNIWLAKQAEQMGVEIFPGFAGSEVLYNDDGSVKGVATGDVGEVKDSFQRGIELHAKQTVFAEGCRGSLTKKLYANPKFQLRSKCEHQTYGLGIKEVWEVDKSVHERGLVMHTLGWPMDSHTYGGSWMYHFDENKISVGFVVALDYHNPYMTPYMEFQRFKHHPKLKPFFENGKCIQYGARTISEGGLQSLPKLSFPGGILVGDTAGFLNVPKIKGIHAAIKSGLIGAEAVVDALETNKQEAISMDERFKSSWLYEELHQVRNFRPYFKHGLYAGIMLGGLDTILLRGKAPWTVAHPAPDNVATKPASECQPIDYPKPDGKISFDLLTNLARANTNHNDDQPPHLKVINKDIPVNVNLKVYAGPEQRYCPARVYEYVKDAQGNDKLQINAQNCVHCKACDIKDPKQNIDWTVPEGGGGPAYFTM